MGIEFTVIICTYNRAELLDGALASVCRQAIAANRFEILVVDNGSTDNTADCIQSYMQRFPKHNLRQIYAAQQGLGYARNVAVQQAQGRYIAFLDDDARAPADYLAQAFVKIHAQPQRPFLCLGGPIEPFYTSPKPVWFKDTYENRTWGNKPRPLQAGESFSGSNMIWHRVDLLTLGGFAEHIGPKGQILSLGEETVVFMTAFEQFAEPLFWYMPTLSVQHWVPAFKMKVSYRLKRAFVSGQVGMRQENRLHGPMYALLGACKGVLMGSLKAVWRFNRFQHWQNWAIEVGQPIMINLGTILAVLGIYVTVRQD